MQLLNDNETKLDQFGGLTLGYAGEGDGAADPAYKYAKGDVFWPVPLSDILVALGDTGPWCAPGLTIDNAATYNTIVRATGAAGTGFTELQVPRNILGNFLVEINPPMMRAFAGNFRKASPHGVKVNYIEVAYKVLGTALPAVHTIALFTRAWPANGAAAPANSAIAHKYYVAGAEVAAANLPKAAHAANVNVVRVVPNAPVFINDFGKKLFMEIQAQPANTGAGDLFHLCGVCANLSVALY
jgi:hypothetical protein